MLAYALTHPVKTGRPLLPAVASREGGGNQLTKGNRQFAIEVTKVREIKFKAVWEKQREEVAGFGDVLLAPSLSGISAKMRRAAKY